MATIIPATWTFTALTTGIGDWFGISIVSAAVLGFLAIRLAPGVLRSFVRTVKAAAR